MSALLEAILAKDYIKASSIFENKLRDLVTFQLEEFKRQSATEILNEVKRWKIVKVRIRHGKIQRRKKVSNLKGYTFRGGRLIRMTVAERRHRKMGQRRGKIKRRSKRMVIRRNMKRALRRRKGLGL